MSAWVLTVLALASSTSTTDLQARAPADLFESSGPAVLRSATDDVTVVRSRPIRIRREVVSEVPTRGVRAPQPRTDLESSSELAVRLELFDGRSCVARLTRSDRAWNQSELITGAIDGEEGSSITLVFFGGAVSGTIRTAHDLFKVRPTGIGTHALVQIDESKFPTCATTEEHVIPGPVPEVGPTAPPELLSLPPIIDILVVYTPQARDAEGGTAAIEALIDLAVAETNQAYTQSQVTQQLRLVHKYQIPSYTETNNFSTELTRLTQPADGWFDEVHTLRDQYGADAVSMIIANVNSCGVAWQMHGINPNFDANAFNVVSRVCATGFYTFGHELGHNMGCAHDRDNSLSTTRRVNVSAGGLEANGSASVPRLSADARYAVFFSLASNLVPGDSNGQGDVVLTSMTTSERLLMSVNSSGVQGNGVSWWPAISADGRYVSFESEADNLVPGDTNGLRDVFVRDRMTSTTSRVSVDSSGVEANGASGFADISADGRFVVFDSDADNLVADDANGLRDVFVHDRVLGTTTRVSVSAVGVEGNGAAAFGALSGDGAWVAYHSESDNLVPGDTNGALDIFVRELATGDTVRASLDSSGVEGDQGSARPVVSFDGRFVAFQSNASNLIASDTNAVQDVFLRDLLLGTTIRVSEGAMGEANNFSTAPSISTAGDFVAFDSDATNLVTGDTNAASDVFVREIATGEIRRVSVSPSGVQGNVLSLGPSISANGRYVAFLSNASNLIPMDFNGATDIFVQDRMTDVTSGATSYSYGYRTTSGLWRTVMGYAPGTRVQYFSNPNVSIGGEPLGLPETDPFGAANWKSLNDTASTVAAWRESHLEAFCFGDGMDPLVTTECPCANFGDPGHGCANSNALLGGGELTAEGTIQPNTLLLTCASVPNNTLCTFLRANATNSAGTVFGDGVSCLSGSALRFGQQSAGQNGNPNNTASAGVATVAPGNTRYYQCQYRNPNAGFCPPGLYNITNGIRIIW